MYSVSLKPMSGFCWLREWGGDEIESIDGGLELDEVQKAFDWKIVDPVYATAGGVAKEFAKEQNWDPTLAEWECGRRSKLYTGDDKEDLKPYYSIFNQMWQWTWSRSECFWRYIHQ